MFYYCGSFSISNYAFKDNEQLFLDTYKIVNYIIETQLNIKNIKEEVNSISAFYTIFYKEITFELKNNIDSLLKRFLTLNKIYIKNCINELKIKSSIDDIMSQLLNSSIFFNGTAFDFDSEEYYSFRYFLRIISIDNNLDNDYSNIILPENISEINMTCDLSFEQLNKIGAKINKIFVKLDNIIDIKKISIFLLAFNAPILYIFPYIKKYIEKYSSDWMHHFDERDTFAIMLLRAMRNKNRTSKNDIYQLKFEKNKHSFCLINTEKKNKSDFDLTPVLKEVDLNLKKYMFNEV